MKKIFKKIGIIAGITVGALACVLALVIGGLNLAKFVIYSDYYGMKTDLCENPGLSDGFVCQGICAYEDGGKIFVSGYMTDDSPSRIYRTDTDNNSSYVELAKPNGDPFTGHAGGIAVYGNTVYVANGGKVHLISLPDLMNTPKGGTVQISDSISVNNEASFIYADENYIYVGEFHDGGKYVTDHPYETAEGLHYAIVSRYPACEMVAFDDGSGVMEAKPDKVYSIRNKVQGICFTPDGKVVLSTSYGITDSVYYVYNESEAVDSGLTLDGAPVYYLDKLEREIKGPAMAEGLDHYDGKVITLTESASDKYIFGKFFFADRIVALDINKQ